MADVEDDDESVDTEVARPEAAPAPVAVRRKARKNVDHLGIPLARVTDRHRFVYARTCTVLYDSKTESNTRAVRQWRLLRDACRIMDCSVAGLRRLYDLYRAMGQPREALVNYSPFRQGLIRHGMRDPVLAKRLFGEFRAPPDPDNPGPSSLNYRHFVRALCSMNKEDAQERISLLFDVWDADDSGKLSRAELAEHVLADVPLHKKAGASRGARPPRPPLINPPSNPHP
jgi:hypothetical protein